MMTCADVRRIAMSRYIIALFCDTVHIDDITIAQKILMTYYIIYSHYHLLMIISRLAAKCLMMLLMDAISARVHARSPYRDSGWPTRSNEHAADTTTTVSCLAAYMSNDMFSRQAIFSLLQCAYYYRLHAHFLKNSHANAHNFYASRPTSFSR